MVSPTPPPVRHPARLSANVSARDIPMHWIIFLSGYVLTWSVIPHVLLSKKRPAATLAWIWSILLFPYLGALVYLLLGADRMKRKRLRRSLRHRMTREDQRAKSLFAIPRSNRRHRRRD